VGAETDGAIMIEGAAERILLPHFIALHHNALAERYITLLEIGGSHAHRLKPLIDLLEIPTLIVSDLDAIDPANNRKSVRPKFGANFETANNVLKSWLPKLTEVDELLAANDIPEIKVGGFGYIGVVYQKAQSVKCKDDATDQMLVPSTFEDALVLSNLELVGDMRGTAMTNTFAKLVTTSSAAEELLVGLFEKLSKNPQKAAFALDLLGIKDIDALTAPPYINDGLKWLEAHLSKDNSE